MAGFERGAARRSEDRIRNLFGTPDDGDLARGVKVPEGEPDPRSEPVAILQCIAQKIGATRRPGAESDIPAGATYMGQFMVHDLDFLTRESTASGNMLDLALIYGDGPRHDAAFYQVPSAPGKRRHLLRLNRTRPTVSSPPWGAARDLPRVACPHLDAKGVDQRSEVLVPNTFSDSNMLLGQFQTVWALLHNGIASTLAAAFEKQPEYRGRGADPYGAAFELARRINRGIYREVICADVLGNWLLPEMFNRLEQDGFTSQNVVLSEKTPVEFMAGVARLGHGLVREIYRLNARRPNEGIRTLVRHTSTGRPHDMPLTEDWLLDFSNFFAIGSSTPQRARALGPHVARAFAAHEGVGVEGSAEGLVLRDLIACSRGTLRSVPSLIRRAERLRPGLFDGRFAQDERKWKETLREWLADAGVPEGRLDAVAGDPPLTLFLMLEADADAGGGRLGALGSFIMGETVAAALPVEAGDAALDAARRQVFGDEVPGTMSAVIAWLQRHYGFADGARLHPLNGDAPQADGSVRGGSGMLDTHVKSSGSEIPLVEVTDYLEMGRLVTDWALGRKERPATVEALKEQLDGIAVVPDRVKAVEFCQGDHETLVIRLPVKEMMEMAIEDMTDPERDGSYPFPQFYSDFYRPGFSPVMTPLDILMSRVGDYTIAQCR